VHFGENNGPARSRGAAAIGRWPRPTGTSRPPGSLIAFSIGHGERRAPPNSAVLLTLRRKRSSRHPDLRVTRDDFARTVSEIGQRHRAALPKRRNPAAHAFDRQQRERRQKNWRGSVTIPSAPFGSRE
jgi:hypothetical protein